jgi:hypothetical protein
MGASTKKQDKKGNTPLLTACIFPARAPDIQKVVYACKKQMPFEVWERFKYIGQTINAKYDSFFQKEFCMNESASDIIALLMHPFRSDWGTKNNNDKSFLTFIQTDVLFKRIAQFMFGVYAEAYIFSLLSREQLIHLLEKAFAAKDYRQRDAIAAELRKRKEQEKIAPSDQDNSQQPKEI